MIEVIPDFHPEFVHFPIAFAMSAIAFISIGTVFRRWSYAAQHCLWSSPQGSAGSTSLREMVAAKCMRLHDSDISGEAKPPLHAIERNRP